MSSKRNLHSRRSTRAKGKQMRAAAAADSLPIAPTPAPSGTNAPAPVNEGIFARLERAALGIVKRTKSAGRRSSAPAVLAEPQDSSNGAAMHPRVIKGRKKDASLEAQIDPVKYRGRLFKFSESPTTGRKAFVEVWDTLDSPVLDEDCPPGDPIVVYGSSHGDARRKMDAACKQHGARTVGAWPAGGF